CSAVAHTCGVLPQVGVSSASHTPPVQSLSGLRLLAWLAQQAASTSIVSALPFLFHRAAAPFLRFLHLWVQEGVHEDPFNEFHISLNSRFLFRKGRFRWCSSGLLETRVLPTIRAVAAFGQKFFPTVLHLKVHQRVR
ncbi:unnamed protein product, partial [Taenia asiatica]|uniref:GCP_N_terminal domain-containing protein n=1 Tax=Taenia asiatica TaxID=60517 RepID=A0A0R3VZU6_TAEAS